ncbi:MAG: transcription elongation factor GreA [bacterium]|nr:transcription elongation factor GreA [bacterium]
MKKTVQEKIKLTQESFTNLEKELADLQENQLPAVVDRIAKAREQGDLSENSEYKDAKDQQELLEVRIGEIQEILAKAQIIKAAKTDNCVGVGSKVTLATADNKTFTYTIISEFDKAAIDSDTLSAVSPIGVALMQKQVGDKVAVQVPAGERIFTIKKID